MIVKFSIFERLGYNEEVSKLAEYVWKLYKEGQREIDLSQYSKDNMSIYVNKLFLDEYRDNSTQSRMSIMFDNILYKNKKDLVIKVNKKYPQTIMTLEHELKHIYDYIKTGADYRKMKDRQFIGVFNQISSEDENTQNFLYIMYIIEMTEITAFFHSDIRNFKENRHKFKNDIKKYIKYSRLKQNLDFINENDITELISKINKNEKNGMMNCYYEIQNNKLYNLIGFEYKFEVFKNKIMEILRNMSILPGKYKQYSDEEIDRFYRKFEKEVERKKKIYRKYIDRLYAYFS